MIRVNLCPTMSVEPMLKTPLLNSIDIYSPSKITTKKLLSREHHNDHSPSGLST